MQSFPLLTSTLLIVQLSVSFAFLSFFFPKIDTGGLFQEQPPLKWNRQNPLAVEMQSLWGKQRPPLVEAPSWGGQTLPPFVETPEPEIITDPIIWNTVVDIGLGDVRSYTLTPPDINILPSHVAKFIPSIMDMLISVLAQEGTFQNLTTLQRQDDCYMQKVMKGEVCSLRLALNVSLSQLEISYPKITVKVGTFKIPLGVWAKVGKNKVHLNVQVNNIDYESKQNKMCRIIITKLEIIDLEKLRVKVKVGKSVFLSDLVTHYAGEVVKVFKGTILSIAVPFVLDVLNSKVLPDLYDTFCSQVDCPF